MLQGSVRTAPVLLWHGSALLLPACPYGRKPLPSVLPACVLSAARILPQNLLFWALPFSQMFSFSFRSEERRVGKECG